MSLEFDAATANAEYSVAGRRVEINDKPWAGMPEMTGGGITIEGQTYVRGTDGRILFYSRGIKTPQELTSKMTLGSFNLLQADLRALAVAQGQSGENAWMDVQITIVDQVVSGNPLAKPFTDTMTVSVGAFQKESPSDGSGWMMNVTWRQHKEPTLSR